MSGVTSTYAESFRDHIPGTDAKNKRLWIHPKKPSGKFHRLRIGVTIFFLGILFGLPFIRMNGHPFFMLNFIQRKFIIFGNIFWPQDTHLLIFLLLIFFLFVILFTVVFGRVWCGWACPQTLFMEMVFRKIEYLIEGDANKQRKLAAKNWTIEWIWKKGIKHFIFILISLLISHTVLAYIVGIDETMSIITHSPAKNPGGFIALMSFTLIFYLVFSVVRELACTVICPYGRLQSVLINKETIVVQYDHSRGEPRGKLTKNNHMKTGDCVDCKLCVQVCPTGIDIRNGLQLECVNCTACIDACDAVMKKIKKPEGLIRYDSESAIGNKRKSIFNARVLAYSSVLMILTGIFFTLIFTRSDIEASLVRAPGLLYQRTETGITNLYNLQVINKTFDSKELRFKIKNSNGTLRFFTGDNFLVPSQGKSDAVLMMELPIEEIRGFKTKIEVEVIENDHVITTMRTNFLGPGILN